MKKTFIFSLGVIFAIVACGGGGSVVQAIEDHVHDMYAAISHGHAEFAGFSDIGHGHEDFADFAAIDHVHPPADHSHANYETTMHTIGQNHIADVNALNVALAGKSVDSHSHAALHPEAHSHPADPDVVTNRYPDALQGNATGYGDRAYPSGTILENQTFPNNTGIDNVPAMIIAVPPNSADMRLRFAYSKTIEPGNIRFLIEINVNNEQDAYTLDDPPAIYVCDTGNHGPSTNLFVQQCHIDLATLSMGVVKVRISRDTEHGGDDSFADVRLHTLQYEFYTEYMVY